MSLACINSHFILRYDDGTTIWNVETTETGRGGWSSQSDEFLIEKHQMPRKAIECGSDLRALTPHELLAVFVGLRARHLQDIGKAFCEPERFLDAERDWLLARHLFPANRCMYKHAMGICILHGEDRFDADETGHPISAAHYITSIYTAHPPRLSRQSRPKPITNPEVDLVFSDLGS